MNPLLLTARRAGCVCLLMASMTLARPAPAAPVTITSLLLTAAVTVETDTNHYYLLLRGTNVAVLTGAVAMALGTGHTVTLFDTNRPPALYRLLSSGGVAAFSSPRLRWRRH